MSDGGVSTLALDRGGADTDRFVAAVGAAFERYGFCAFAGHGIDDATIADAYDASRRFFALPATVKARYAVPGGGGARGYTGFAIETARDSTHPDLKEFWQIGRELPAGHHEAHRMPPNRWPDEVPELAAAGLALYDALDRLGVRILRLLARYLGLAATAFDEAVAEGNSILRLLHYPPIAEDRGGSVRAAQHEDINLLTLLLGADGPGLELLTRDGRWLPVTVEPGAVVCNVGDMLQRLTNHVLPSTTHRVVNPPGALGRRSRYSLPFFLHPRPAYLIRTLPTCIGADQPDRYPKPILAYDFLQERLREIRLLAGDPPAPPAAGAD